MVRLMVVPVIPLAMSDAMNAANVRHLLERHEPFPVGPTREHLLPLFPGHAARLGARLVGVLDGASLRHGVRSQTDHANAVRCELGRESSCERLLGGLSRTVASYQRNAFPR